MNKTIGLVLTGVGMMILVWTGFSFTKKEQIIDAGIIQVSADRQKADSWPLQVGTLLLAGGIVIVLMSNKEDQYLAAVSTLPRQHKHRRSEP